jgi:hypothetical protein
MYDSNKTTSCFNAQDDINRKYSSEKIGSNGLFAQMRLCCLLYTVVALLPILALTLSAQVYPAVIGVAMLVTSYVVCLMVEFVFCGDRNELHR